MSFIEANTTVEGDPVVQVYFTEPGRGVAIFIDATRDSFGSGTWEHYECDGIDTEIPSEATHLPDSYFTGEGCQESD